MRWVREWIASDVQGDRSAIVHVLHSRLDLIEGTTPGWSTLEVKFALFSSTASMLLLVCLLFFARESHILSTSCACGAHSKRTASLYLAVRCSDGRIVPADTTPLRLLNLCTLLTRPKHRSGPCNWAVRCSCALSPDLMPTANLTTDLRTVRFTIHR
jgi:hypothetical protein